MDELHTSRHQRDAAIGIAAWGTVFQIAFDGTTHRCQLTTNLVVATRHQIHFEKCVVVAVANHAIFQDGYPDRSAGFKAFFTHDQIYGNTEPPAKVDTDMYEVICGFDPNGGGKDSACAVARQGRAIIDIEVYNGVKSSLELANLFLAFKHKHNAIKAYCDKGYGEGVLAIAAQMQDPVIPVYFGGLANNTNTYGNKRAEMYGRARDWLNNGGYLGDPKKESIIELKRELQAIEWNLRKSDDGKIWLCSKDDIRKKLHRSTDYADAFVLTFAGFKDRVVQDAYGHKIDLDGDSYKVFDQKGYDFRNYLK